jgi:hypothetical protein
MEIYAILMCTTFNWGETVCRPACPLYVYQSVEGCTSDLKAIGPPSPSHSWETNLICAKKTVPAWEPIRPEQ